jgi:hypothetical protein
MPYTGEGKVKTGVRRVSQADPSFSSPSGGRWRAAHPIPRFSTPQAIFYLPSL